MIQGMFDKGALPTLERLAQFTEKRHRVLTNNVANLSNPYYKPGDLDPESFQATLREAIDQRRRGVNPTGGPLKPRDTDQINFNRDGITTQPQALNETILFHDRSNVDLERTMQRLVENAMVHNTAVELIRNQFAAISKAIRERP